MSEETKTPLTPTDIKNWFFCARIPYFHHHSPMKFRTTPPMELGRFLHDERSGTGFRSTGAKYGFPVRERKFGVPLSDRKNGFFGKLDLLLVTEEGLSCPVEFKNRTKNLNAGTRGQLLSYAFLLRNNGHTLTPHGFICGLENGGLRKIEIDAAGVDLILVFMNEIRKGIDNEIPPAPTIHKNKCMNCSYLRFCDDIY